MQNVCSNFLMANKGEFSKMINLSKKVVIWSIFERLP